MKRPVSKLAKILKYFAANGTDETAAVVAKKLKVSVPLVYKARNGYRAGSAAAKQPTANKEQFGGDHYKVLTIQPWDYIIQNNLGFLEGNVIKYVSRWRRKGGVEDLKKARHFLDMLIEKEVKQ
jgi:transposase